MTQPEDPAQSERKASTTPTTVNSTGLAEFMESLAEPDDTERQAMAEIGRQPGATGLDPTGKLVTVL